MNTSLKTKMSYVRSFRRMELTDTAYDTICKYYTNYIMNINNPEKNNNYSFEELYRFAYKVGNSDKSPDFILKILNVARDSPKLTDLNIKCIRDLIVYIEKIEQVNLLPLLKFLQKNKP